MSHKSDYLGKISSVIKGTPISPQEVKKIRAMIPSGRTLPHRRGFGGSGSSPVKFRKREGGLGD